MGKETALPKNIRQIGDIRGRERIYLEDYVMTYIRKKEKQEEQGYLGIFLGERQEAEESVFLFVRGILEVPEIPTEGQEDKALLELIQAEREKHFPEWEVQGCCVIGTYPADRMEKLTELIPETGRMLYHLQEQEETLYWMEEGRYERIKGYFVFYEQNRKMQEYLAELFQENSVEKESLPDKAIRSFRQKVKEKGLQKNRSMLKLASSFFVVTVLVIGAIAVNRVDEIRTFRNMSGNSTAENEAVQNDVNTIVKEAEQTDALISADGAARDGAQAAGNERKQISTKAGAGETVETGIQTAAGGTVQNGMQAAASETVQNGMQAATSETVQNGMQAAMNEDVQDNVRAAADEAVQNNRQSASSEAAQQMPVDAAPQADTDSASADGNAPDESQRLVNGALMQTQTVRQTESESVQQASMGSAPAAPGEKELAGSDSFWEDTEAENTSEEEAHEAAAVRRTQAAYIIKEGDTLADICSRYYGSLEKLATLCEANEIEDANVIMPGQKIVLP